MGILVKIRIVAKTLSSSLLYFAAFLTAFILTLYASGVPLTLPNVALFLSLNYEPKNSLEAIALMLVFFLELSPLMAFVEIRTISQEEKAEILASAMEGHVIVVGCGHLGMRAVSWLLGMGEKVVLIVLPEDARRNEFVRQLMRKKVPVILGDARFEEVLLKANVKRASAVIVTIDNDSANISIAKKVKSLNPRAKVIIRIFDDTLADLALKAGIADEVMSSTSIAVGRYIIGAYFNIEEETSPIPIRVGARSRLVGLRISDIERYGVKVLAMKRGDAWLHGPDKIIREGDILFLHGSPENFGRLISSLGLGSNEE